TGKDNVGDRWMNEYQHEYTKESFQKFTSKKRTELPLLVDLGQKGKVLITESDLYNYPSLYFTKGKESTLKSIFPPRVKKNRKNVKGKNGWDRTIHPESVY